MQFNKKNSLEKKDEKIEEFGLNLKPKFSSNIIHFGILKQNKIIKIGLIIISSLIVLFNIVNQIQIMNIVDKYENQIYVLDNNNVFKANMIRYGNVEKQYYAQNVVKDFLNLMYNLNEKNISNNFNILEKKLSHEIRYKLNERFFESKTGYAFLINQRDCHFTYSIDSIYTNVQNNIYKGFYTIKFLTYFKNFSNNQLNVIEEKVEGIFDFIPYNSDILNDYLVLSLDEKYIEIK